ncbi:MAG: LemA family protein [Armatimonadetes bacterium]|nr:LemA family protein [Armatimonadota bacterium]
MMDTEIIAPVFCLAAFVILPVIWLIATQNRGVALRNNLYESRSNIEIQLKRRHDLIPNLVEMVKGVTKHEEAVFTRLAEAREAAVQELRSEHHRYDREKEFVQAVNQLVARLEAYPQLRANENFLALQQELVMTEDRIAAARRFYNGNARAYNNLLEMFPSNLVVKGTPASFFEADPVVYQVPSTAV